jgi:hypothetical protein
MNRWFRRSRTAVVVLTVVAALGAVAGSAGAISTPPVASPLPPVGGAGSTIGTLRQGGPILHFAGAVTNPTPLPLVNEPVPVVCAAMCQAFRFTAATTKAFLVSVRDATSSVDNGWDLYVYDPKGALAGAANGIGADGQAVAVDHAVRGVYQVIVTFTYAEDPGAHYTGEVRLTSGRVWHPPAATCGITVGGARGCFALPRLEAVPASDLHVDGLPPIASTPLGFPLPAALPTASSCYLDESYGLTTAPPDTSRLTRPARRCLRFTTDVRNVGAGPFDIRIPWAQFTNGVSTGFAQGECVAEQAVTAVKGAVLTRPAGGCLWHAAHAHFHYRDLVAFSLHAANRDNDVIGRAVGNSLKASFCLGDDDYFGYATPGPNGARVYVGQPGCNEPSDVAANAIRVDEGISPGWGDVYTWDTPDQYIDITNTPPGLYYLVEQTNPSGAILVSGPQSTCSATLLELTPTAVKMLKQSPSVPCPAR